MTWQNHNAPDDQWLFMPALGQLQRIAQGSRTSYFMGSDYTYEDLYDDDSPLSHWSNNDRLVLSVEYFI